MKSHEETRLVWVENWDWSKDDQDPLCKEVEVRTSCKERGEDHDENR